MQKPKIVTRANGYSSFKGEKFAMSFSILLVSRSGLGCTTQTEVMMGDDWKPTWGGSNLAPRLLRLACASA